jgi:hypothetical protein
METGKKAAGMNRGTIFACISISYFCFFASKASALDGPAASAEKRLAQTAAGAEAAAGASTSEGMSQQLQTALDGSGQAPGAVFAGQTGAGKGRKGLLPDRKSGLQNDQPVMIQTYALTPEPPKGPADRDTSKQDQAKKDEALMGNLKKDAIGGLYGAAGFGMLGLIFGGPVGALVGALIGFAMMGSIIHLANSK